MLEERDEMLAHLTENNSEQEKLEDNMVILRSENDCVEKHVRDVEKSDESLLKNRNYLLESSTEERAQKEEEIVNLNEQIIKLEEWVSILLASKEHAETEVSRVEKSMLEERDQLLAHSKAQQANLEENMVILKADNDCVEKHFRYVKKREE